MIVTEDSVSPENIGREGTFGTASLTVLEANPDRLTTPVPASGPCQAITIGALPGRLINKSVTITGTTTLPAGTELLFRVFPAVIEVSMNLGTPGMSASGTGAVGTVEVVRGTGDTNTWSADLDLSQFPPNEYLMNVSNDRIDPRSYDTLYGDAYCSKRFTLPG